MNLQAMACVLVLGLTLAAGTLPAAPPDFGGLESADEPGVGDVNVVPATPQARPALGDSLLVGVADQFSREQAVSLVLALEARLAGREAIAGVVDDGRGERVELLPELRRQTKLWQDSVSRAYVSVRSDAPLADVSAEDFVEAPGLDGRFDELFDAVIDGDVSVETSTPGIVNPVNNQFVAERYLAIEADVLQYNNAVFLQSFATDPEIKTSASRNVEAVALRLKAHVDELKTLFIEG